VAQIARVRAGWGEAPAEPPRTARYKPGSPALAWAQRCGGGKRRCAVGARRLDTAPPWDAPSASASFWLRWGRVS